MTIWLLGPLRVDGGTELSPRDRVVLSALAIHPRDVLPAERLADALWGETPPASWAKVVHGSVWRLRKVLGKGAIETTTSGYRLTLADEEIDVRRFERLVARGRSLEAAGEHDRAAAVLDQALALWRGPALADLERWPLGALEAARLDEVRRSAGELRLSALLASGHDVVAEATAAVSSQPMSEHRWAMLARALYRTGRQTEALGALRRARTTLEEELGLDPGLELQQLERAILVHDPELAPADGRLRESSEVCPYKGLLFYGQDDGASFFGRDHDVARCLQTLRATNLLVIVGPSGSGKSSVARAGVAHALAGSGRQVVVITPGTEPAGALTAALATPGRDQVVVIDQLEELFTSGQDAETVRRFLDAVADLVHGGRQVVLVVRADQVGGFSLSPTLGPLAEGGLHLLTAMSDVALREAIEGPAQQAGLRLEAGLVELLLREVESEPGALPLLSHALAETWARREAGVLTVEGYLATGGIRGAVAQSAENLWESLPPAERATVRALLLRMVTSAADGEPVAARLPLSGIAGDADKRRLLEMLGRCRLVTTDERNVTVAHEAVLRAWPRLRSWIDEDAAGQQILRHLTVAAEDWQTRGRSASDLYRGTRLAAALDWHRRTDDELTAVEDAFLAASEQEAEAEAEAVRMRAHQQARQNRRLRLTATGTAVGLVLSSVAGLVAVQQSRTANHTARAALVDQLVAQSVALRSTQRDLAALLAREAERLSPEPKTRSALFGVFTGTPGFMGYVSTRKGHPQGPPGPRLTSGHLLSNDRTLLAAGTDGVIRVVDLERGWTGARFPAPTTPTTNAVMDLSQDEQTLALVSWGGPESGDGEATLGVYDVASRQRRLPDARLPMDAGAVAVGPDGRYVAVAGYDDGRVLIFDTLGVTNLPELSGVEDPAPGVVALPPVGPAAKLQAVEDYLASGRLPEIPPSNEVRYTAGLAFRGDGRLVAGSEAGIVRVVEPGTGRELDRLVGRPLTSNINVLVSADGTELVTTGSRGVVRWDLDRGRPAWSTTLARGSCAGAVLHLPERRVLCGGRSSRVQSLDLDTGTPTGSPYDMQSGPIAAMQLSDDDRVLVQLSRGRGVVATWRLDGGGPLTRSLPSRSTPLGYNSDGTRLLVTSARTGPTEHITPVSTVLSATSGDVVMETTDYAGTVWTGKPEKLVGWDFAGDAYTVDVRNERRARFVTAGILGLNFSGAEVAVDGGLLLGWVGPQEGGSAAWFVWEIEGRRLVAAQTYISGSQASISSDGRRLVWVDDESASTYDVATERRVATRRGLRFAVMSPQGTVTASRDDGRLAFYHGRTLRQLGPPVPGTFGDLQQLDFSADGRALVALSSSGAVLMIDTVSRSQLGEPIELGGDRTRAVALRPDGRELAVPGQEEILRWDLRPATWRSAACRVAGRNLTREEWDTYLAATGPYRTTCPSG